MPAIEAWRPATSARAWPEVISHVTGKPQRSADTIIRTYYECLLILMPLMSMLIAMPLRIELLWQANSPPIAKARTPCLIIAAVHKLLAVSLSRALLKFGMALAVGGPMRAMIVFMIIILVTQRHHPQKRILLFTIQHSNRYDCGDSHETD